MRQVSLRDYGTINNLEFICCALAQKPVEYEWDYIRYEYITIFCTYIKTKTVLLYILNNKTNSSNIFLVLVCY